MIGDVLVVRWDTAPDLAGAAGVLKLAGEVHRAAGKKIALLVLVTPGTGVPSPAVRKAFTDNMKTMMDYARCVIMVLEGEGIGHSIVLSVVTGMQLLSRQRGIYSRSSLDEALLRKPPPELGVHGPALIAEIRSRGL